MLKNVCLCCWWAMYFQTVGINFDSYYSYQGLMNDEDFSGTGSWSANDQILTFINNGQTILLNYSTANNDNLSFTVTNAESDVYS